MFDIGGSELLVIGIVALIVVGPKDLPRMFHALGQFTAKARSMARDFQRAMETAADEAGAKDIAKDLEDHDLGQVAGARCGQGGDQAAGKLGRGETRQQRRADARSPGAARPRDRGAGCRARRQVRGRACQDPRPPARRRPGARTRCQAGQGVARARRPPRRPPRRRPRAPRPKTTATKPATTKSAAAKGATRTATTKSAATKGATRTAAKAACQGGGHGRHDQDRRRQAAQVPQAE